MSSAETETALAEIARLLDEAYDHYFANSDGHCKSSEGYIEIGYPTYFDRRDGAPMEPTSIGVYSYVLGPSRMHHFESVSAALEAVREWHRAEMETDYSGQAEETEKFMDEVGRPFIEQMMSEGRMSINVVTFDDLEDLDSAQ